MGGPGATTMRLAARDRAHAAVDHIRVLGPFAGIGAADLARALRRLHAVEPTDPLVCRLSSGRRHWLPVAADDGIADLLAEAVVAAGDSATAAVITSYLLHHRLGDLPMLAVVGGGHVGLRISHAFGDNRTLATVLPDLLNAAATGRCPLRRSAATTVRSPLITALRHQVLRDPGQFVAALHRRRPPRTDPPADDPGRRWLPRPAYHSACSPGALPGLLAWRDAFAPGVRVTAMLAAATWTAFATAGLGPQRPGYTTLVDLRRYLPPGVTVPGNFSWDHDLTPDDPTDPVSVHRALNAELASGAPLLALARHTARQALPDPGHPDEAGTRFAMIPTRPGVELSFASTGHLDGYERLPSAGPHDEHCDISAPAPLGPCGASVAFSQLHGTLQVNVGFHASTFDRTVVAAAVDRLCADPTALLPGPPPSPDHYST